MTSNKPYLIRAFYDWISDNNMTPYIVVNVNVPGVLVPNSFVKDGQIVLNVSAGAVGQMAMSGEYIQFDARFAGRPEHIIVPFGAVSAIYAKENGAGTSFAIEAPLENGDIDIVVEPSALTSVPVKSTSTEPSVTELNKPSKKGKPSLTVVK